VPATAGQATDEENTMGDTSRRTALEVVEAMEDSLNDNVREGQEADWADDMAWYGPGGIGTRRGLEEFARYRSDFIAAFPDKRLDDHVRFGDGGDYVAAGGVQHATHAGDWLGIPATGKRVEVKYMDIWRAENGFLKENWVMIDILDFLDQIGYDVVKVLAFVGEKGPEFFAALDPSGSVSDS
jgi:predicted ester cyclase